MLARTWGSDSAGGHLRAAGFKRGGRGQPSRLGDDVRMRRWSVPSSSASRKRQSVVVCSWPERRLAPVGSAVVGGKGQASASTGATVPRRYDSGIVPLDLFPCAAMAWVDVSPPGPATHCPSRASWSPVTEASLSRHVTPICIDARRKLNDSGPVPDLGRPALARSAGWRNGGTAASRRPRWRDGPAGDRPAGEGGYFRAPRVLTALLAAPPPGSVVMISKLANGLDGSSQWKSRSKVPAVPLVGFSSPRLRSPVAASQL